MFSNWLKCSRLFIMWLFVLWFVYESSESGWNCFENLLISFMAWITHVYVRLLRTLTLTLRRSFALSLFFSSLILTRIWIIYIPQKCVGSFDFPFPAGYTHINLSACFIFVLFFVIVYIVFFLFNILRGCIRWTTRDIYDGIHLNVQNLWDSCVIACMHSNWLPHHIGWKK